MNADQALKKLIDGNKRYVADQLEHPRVDIEHRQQLTDGQNPFAVVLCCSDSRVVPELIFDCGLGDLFVIRVAGNIVDDAVLGSIEYATVMLETPLVVVLGHESCGAVTAALTGDETDLHIDELVRAIRPAVEKVPADTENRLETTVRTHASLTAGTLANSPPVLHDLFAEGKVALYSAYYHLSDGQVEFLADSPSAS